MKKLRDVVRGESLEELWRVYRRVVKGELELIDPKPPRNLLEYLKRLDHSLWFWATLAFIVATLACIHLSYYTPIVTPLRYVLGSIYVLFIPGYVLVEALYPEEKSLTPLERLALSIGLSLAIVPLIGLLLNYTPWGIRLEPIIVSTTVYDVALLMMAAYRKVRVAQLKTSVLHGTR